MGKGVRGGERRGEMENGRWEWVQRGMRDVERGTLDEEEEEGRLLAHVAD